MEVLYQEVTYITKLLCPKCEIEMIMQNGVIIDNGARHQYVCPWCGRKEVSAYTYPRKKTIMKEIR